MRGIQSAVIAHNRKVHDANANSYDAIHKEIRNPTEQSRIKGVIDHAVSAITTLEPSRVFLDFGSGTGNLTRHLLAHSGQVISADISLQSLKEVRRKHPATPQLSLLQLNGLDISSIRDNSLDLVGTYSVLHHVPEYLAVVREFCRVTKPGGVIYIDHECAPEFWDNPSESYLRYQYALASRTKAGYTDTLLRRVSQILSPAAWRRLINRRVFGLNEEGDIHVTDHDHVNWASIGDLLQENCDLVVHSDYLLCRGTGVEASIYREFAGTCADMRFAIYRKRSNVGDRKTPSHRPWLTGPMKE